MCECNPDKYKDLERRMDGKPVKIITEKVTPDNILAFLEKYSAPKDFYLSLDIDGYDYFVLEKILSNYSPSLIISEINEKIPPGLMFSVKYDDKYWWDGSHFYGYSISMLEPILKKYNYKISELDYNNVVLVSGQQEESLSAVYNRGYLEKSDRKQRFYYNQDFEEIYSLDKEKQIDFINQKFLKFKNKYLLS